MDILKIATDWAKDELVSTTFFIAIGLAFLMASFGFWQFGKTDLARSYIIPILVAGSFLLSAGFGLFFTNKSRLEQFQKDYASDAKGFVLAEIERTTATLKEYKTIVFTAIPIIILACAVLIFLINTPLWRASMISTIAMLSVILIIDGLAHARIQNYHADLLLANEKVHAKP